MVLSYIANSATRYPTYGLLLLEMLVRRQLLGDDPDLTGTTMYRKMRPIGTVHLRFASNLDKRRGFHPLMWAGETFGDNRGRC